MTTPLTGLYDNWTRPSYEVRIRPASSADPTLPIFLWGSAGMPDISYDKPPILHIRNATFGDVVTVGTQVKKKRTEYGTLQPGECVSIQLGIMSGVYATCPTESVVACVITS
jgi:hypothetical protein